MKILLINHNPVVSRLTALSAKKENVALDEIREISELQATDYSIVFVDSESYNSEVENILKNSGIEKRVLFYAQGDEYGSENFSEMILKPFLPSEVSAILRETKVELYEKEQQSSTREEEFSDLNELIETRENTVDRLQIDEKLEEVEEITDKKGDIDTLNLLKQELESQKEQTTKTEKESEAFDLKLDETLPLDLNNDNKGSDEKELDLVTEQTTNKEEEIFNLDKELEAKGLDNNLSLDLESPAKTKATESKQENETVTQETTKILDVNEISNIKELLNEESTPDKEDTTTKVEEADSTPVVEEKTEREEIAATPVIEDNIETDEAVNGQVIAETLKSLPVEELRRFLRGAKIHITIEFPNEI